MKRALGFLLMIGLSDPPWALARPKGLAAIDQYCTRLKAEFRESEPYIFAGPDPWAPLAFAPATLTDEALAYVYLEGAQIRLVVLVIPGPKDEWVETVNYFFDRAAWLVKRERFLDQPLANSAFEEIRYYRNGSLLWEDTRHHPLRPGHEDDALFEDPGAPDYPAVDDLPFPESPEFWRQLAKRPVRPMPDRYPRSNRRDLPVRLTAAPAQE